MSDLTFYRPGSSLSPQDLNDLQDDYDATLFASWKRFGWAEHSLGDGPAAGSVILLPISVYGHSLETGEVAFGVRSTFMMDASNDFPVGNAAAGRTGQIRLVADITTNAVNAPTRLASIHLKPATINSDATVALGTALTTLTPGVIAPSTWSHHESPPCAYPALGLFTLEFVITAAVTSHVMNVHLTLQHRQVQV